MFEASERPRLFALPCGVDFGAEVVRGILERLDGQSPEALARVEIIVNTSRTQRRLIHLFETGSARLLPRIKLIATIGKDDADPEEDTREAKPALERKLELMGIVQRFLATAQDVAPRDSAFDLADSIASLFAEMAEEDVPLDALGTIDTGDQSGHWERAQNFLQIVAAYLAQTEAPPNPRHAIEALIAKWAIDPPTHPILVVGSTGSRAPARLLMEAVAKLPQGAVIMPGVDTEMPAHGWASLREGDGAGEKLRLSQDHPQFRTLALADTLGLDPGALPRWTDRQAPSPARNALVSLALRPAPVTHAWLSEGPGLEGLEQATEALTMLEAPTLRDEAIAIALRLRQAAEMGTQAALVSPDRTLTRLVTAALDRWDILPDDSAGIPMHLTAPGRFLRHITEIRSETLSAEKLIILLKHPLCHSGTGRNDHLRHTRDLELQIRSEGIPFPTASALLEITSALKAEDWGKWLVQCLFGSLPEEGPAPLASHVETLFDVAESFARGSKDDAGTGLLWSTFEGQAAKRVADKLIAAAPAGPDILPRDLPPLVTGLLSSEQQRERDSGHPGIRIWGTLEARVMDAELLILAGLNEGSWPEAPNPDPWLNRAMRKEIGLLLPERRIGLSAHDFQQAIGGPEVWLTRSVRNDGAETVPSRWWNRLTNLLAGLEAGKPALEAMQARGKAMLALGREIEAVEAIAPAPRPSPRPPVETRPKALSVTEIKTLVRDPYAIYAKHVLGLRKLEPLSKTPDPATRGTVLHEALEVFVQGGDISTAALLSSTASTLALHVPWPEARLIWQARIARIAERFIEAETNRQARATPAALEVYGTSTIPHLGFTLKAKADRIDQAPDGALHIYDYKTGAPPTDPQQKRFDKQLLLTAAMAEAGAFAEVPAAHVAHAEFLGLNKELKSVKAPLDDLPPKVIWGEFEELIAAMQSPDFGFTARRAMERETFEGDFDHLSRHGEWDTTKEPTPEDIS